MGKGFTLIELVLTIAILGVLGMAIGPGLATSIQSYSLVAQRRLGVSEVRAAMDRMIYEISLIEGSAQINSLGLSDFQFEYPSGTQIRYYLNGSNLIRNNDVLASDLSDLSFRYLDESANQTGSISAVRSIEISLTTNMPYSLRTRIFLINTGNNYGGFKRL